MLESNFYAWRATGDTKYLQRAKLALENFKKWLRTSNSAPGGMGYAGLENVNDPLGGGQIDDTRRFITSRCPFVIS